MKTQTEALFTCSKCGSTSVGTYLERDMPANHVMQETVTCNSCGHQWAVYWKPYQAVEFDLSEHIPPHPKHGPGLCPVCNHYGDDCTGE